MGANHTYRYINTGSLIVETPLVSVGDFVYGTATGAVTTSMPSGTIQFKVLYVQEGCIKLLGRTFGSRYTWTQLYNIWPRWTVKFDGNVLTIRTKTVSNCVVPTKEQLDQFDSATLSGITPGTSSSDGNWTLTELSSSTAYYLNYNGYISNMSKSVTASIAPYVEVSYAY